MVATKVNAESPDRPHSTPITPEVKAAAAANGNFAVDLYKHLAQGKSGENVFVSPFSISLALTMAAEGAVDETLRQMSEALHFPAGDLAAIHQGQSAILSAVTPSIPKEATAKLAKLREDLKAANVRTAALEKASQFDQAQSAATAGRRLANEINALMQTMPGYQLKIANALWVEQSFPLSPQYVNVLNPRYGSVVFPIDFKQTPQPSRLRINQWVAQQTNDRIRDLLAPQDVTDMTRLVIANAVFFKGDWAAPFEASLTRPEPFATANNHKTPVPMMHQQNSKTAGYAAFQSTGEIFQTPREIPVEMKDDDPSLYPDAEGFTMLSLDYQGHKVQMFVLVPQTDDGLSRLEQSLTYEKLHKFCEAMARRTVDISLPKYKLEAKYSLPETLKGLGIVRAFRDPGQYEDAAQFGKLTTSKRPEDRLSISDVIHKTYVDVSEVGTEAAAATAVIMVAPTSAPFVERPKTRPFIPIFKADKPFLFLIRDAEMQTILFMGRYAVPKA